MDVINFSGGGPQTDPLSDALIEAVRNVSAAGVVPVISAGNDRDDYGVGSAGSPGSAPDAISVAALSNSHVYAPALSVSAPGTPERADADPVRAHRRPGDTGRLGDGGPARSSTSARSSAPTASRCRATSAARPATSTAARARFPPAR